MQWGQVSTQLLCFHQKAETMQLSDHSKSMNCWRKCSDSCLSVNVCKMVYLTCPLMVCKKFYFFLVIFFLSLSGAALGKCNQDIFFFTTERQPRARPPSSSVERKWVEHSSREALQKSKEKFSDNMPTSQIKRFHLWRMFSLMRKKTVHHAGKERISGTVACQLFREG